MIEIMIYSQKAEIRSAFFNKPWGVPHHPIPSVCNIPVSPPCPSLCVRHWSQGLLGLWPIFLHWGILCYNSYGLATESAAKSQRDYLKQCCPCWSPNGNQAWHELLPKVVFLMYNMWLPPYKPYNTSGMSSCKTFFYYIFYVNDLILREKWL